MSAYGPKRTCHFAVQESAFGGRADIEIRALCIRLCVHVLMDVEYEIEPTGEALVIVCNSHQQLLPE